MMMMKSSLGYESRYSNRSSPLGTITAKQSSINCPCFGQHFKTWTKLCNFAEIAKFGHSAISAESAISRIVSKNLMGFVQRIPNPLQSWEVDLNCFIWFRFGLIKMWLLLKFGAGWKAVKLYAVLKCFMEWKLRILPFLPDWQKVKGIFFGYNYVSISAFSWFLKASTTYINTPTHNDIVFNFLDYTLEDLK